MERHTQKIAVIGAGIVGLSTAYTLFQQGFRQIELFEQHHIGHHHSSSRGHSRLLRFEYGADIFYPELAQLSIERWRLLEDVSGLKLYSPTGVLTLGDEQDGFTRSSYHVLREMGLPIEALSADECRRRFPQFQTDQYGLRYYNSEGGMLHADQCLRVLRMLIQNAGIPIHEQCKIEAIEHDQRYQPVRLRLENGDRVAFDKVVIAVGPWIHHFMPELQLPLHITGQFLCYFDNMPRAYVYPNCPAFMAGELYGFPIQDTGAGYGEHWFKAANHASGQLIDPEKPWRIEPKVISETVSQLSALLPSLKRAEFVHMDVCMYDLSPDEDFIIDSYPDDPRLIVATGMSGHAFKFGLMLGEMIASLVTESKAPVSLERFRMARFPSASRMH